MASRGARSPGDWLGVMVQGESRRRSSRTDAPRACGARPSGGGPARGKWPCDGRPGNGAKGGFLGGMRSARPHGKAGRKPGHVVITRGVPLGDNQKEPRSGLRHAVFAGVRSPPLRGGPSKLGWPCGEVPEMTREAVFSEGCAPRVRKERPNSNQGMS